MMILDSGFHLPMSVKIVAVCQILSRLANIWKVIADIKTFITHLQGSARV